VGAAYCQDRRQGGERANHRAPRRAGNDGAVTDLKHRVGDGARAAQVGASPEDPRPEKSLAWQPGRKNFGSNQKNYTRRFRGPHTGGSPLQIVRIATVALAADSKGAQVERDDARTRRHGDDGERSAPDRLRSAAAKYDRRAADSRSMPTSCGSTSASAGLSHVNRPLWERASSRCAPEFGLPLDTAPMKARLAEALPRELGYGGTSQNGTASAPSRV
jgi:hypothetical protein